MTEEYQLSGFPQYSRFVNKLIRGHGATPEDKPTLYRLASFLGAAIPIGFVACLFYAGIYLFAGIDQALLASLDVALSIGASIGAFFLARSGKVTVAILLIAFIMVFLYGGLAFVFSNAMLYLFLGGAALISLIGFLLLPRRWAWWGPAYLLLTAVIWLAEVLEPLPRYSIEDSLALQIFIPAVTATLLLVIVGAAVRNVMVGSIRTRLFTSFISLTVFSVILVGASSIVVGRINIERQVSRQLQSIATIKVQEIETWLNSLQTNLAIATAGGSAGQRIEQLLTATDTATAAYQDAELQIRNRLRQTIELSGSEDIKLFQEIFLVDIEGRIVLSTDTLQEGKLVTAETYYQEGLAGVNYTHPPAYSPAIDETTVVTVRPVFNDIGRVIGMVAGRANMARLNEIMLERAGLGDTGETYLVGQNRVLLTDSRFAGYPADDTFIRTAATNAILENQNNSSGTYEGYRGDTVVGFYDWIDELQVGLVAEQSEAEVLATSRTILTNALAVMAFTAVLASVVAYFITRSIANPLGQLTHIATEITTGNLNLAADIERADEIGTLATAFNGMTSQLRELVASLEQRVLDRTQALATSSEVGRQLSTILDQERLVQEVVNQVQSAFDYYHAHMYLMDETGKNLVMVGGTGVAGQQMLADGHKIAIGKGLVGRAAKANAPILVPDVTLEPEWLSNPLLPETKAEVAVPIAVGDEVLGVLDVQHNLRNGLQEDDRTLLQSIANQVAIALRNARLYEDIQTQARREALVNSINQQILSTTDMESAMQVAIRELGRATRATNTQIRLQTGVGSIREENGSD